MESLLQDIRYAARKLIHAPGCTFVAVTTLALAIGATTAIFSIVNAVLLKPLPYHEPNQLVLVASTNRDGKLNAMSTLDFIDYRDQSTSFAGMAAFDPATFNITDNSMEPTRVRGARVGASFFELMGAPMQLGRGFAAGEDQPKAQRAVVLSDALWRGKYGADRRIVGQQIRLDGEMYTVVGVASRDFNFPARVEAYVPFVFEAWQTDPQNRGSHNHMAIGRVKDGISVDAASRELLTISERLAAQYPESNTNFRGKASVLQEYIVGKADKPLKVMFGAVVLVLLIACANVANLLLVRASARESEMAVRTALGAGRGRIVRQLVTESALLSLVGAVAGAAVAAWAVAGVVAFGPTGLPRLAEVAIDAKVLGFAAIVGVLTGIFFGLVPAFHAARPDIARMLRESVRGSSKGGAHRTRSALVVAEMTLAVVLLVGAGLLIRSFVRLINVDPGFNPQNVVAFNLALPASKYQYERHVRAFVAQLRERAEQIPGTRAVGVTFGRPLEQSGMIRTSFEVEGWAPSTPQTRRISQVQLTSAGYFTALGIPLIRGRYFTPQDDRADAPPVILVTQEFVRKFFPNEDPIGKRITYAVTHDTAATGQGEATVRGEVIGIVGDVKQQDLAVPPYPTSYATFNSFAIGVFSVLVRTDADTRGVQSRLRTIVKELDADLPIYGMTTMEQAVSDSVAQPRFYMMLLGSFAAIALLLAALGIYGVISYAVSQRTRELGIRVALGATRERIVREVLREGAMLSAVGIVVGIGVSLVAARGMGALIFGIGRFDPLTLVVAPLTLLGAALLGCYLPARRAAEVDPALAMRTD